MIRLLAASVLVSLPVRPVQFPQPAPLQQPNYGQPQFGQAPVPLAPPAPAVPPAPPSPPSPGAGYPADGARAAPPAPADAPPAAPPAAAAPPDQAPAQQSTPFNQGIPPGTANLWVPRPVADLQALDKVDAQVQSLTLKVGQTVQFGALTITLRACVGRPADQPQDSAAFLDIADAHAGQASFHGWMFASEPEVSMLEDPVYDIRLNACHS